MPCLMHLGLHCWFRCCTGALQGRCTYNAHTRPDAKCLFKSIRSEVFLLVAVRALYRSAVRTAPIYFREGQCFGAVQALFISAVRTAPMKKSAWCSSFFQVRRCTYRSTYSDLYSAQGIFFITFQNDVTLPKFSIYMADCLWLVFNTTKIIF